ncbi:ATP-binding cassette domain-containing protein [uncultured Faecalicoccus sp.]|uniref:ABC transporter ATP-binding protein n=1 Tax=uncultured Faecalicoccus sp. TaxID=1971760 RepID=UPI002608682F|nr:ATP-binding cassette domain-containing protein [uncultured Faecalicoccus sp.]
MLELENVSVTFNKGTSLEKVALKEINVTIQDGDFITMLGSNGAGKSTLFNVISGAILPSHGKIYLDSEEITKQKEHIRAKNIGRLFQNPEHGTAPHLTVEENLALAYSPKKYGKLSLAVHKQDRLYFQEKLKTLDMGLEDRLKTPIGLLSGGQRQAVALMMALLNPPKILLLDEHTAALDPKSAQKILKITNDLIQKEKITALMITHNIQDALNNGNRLFIMNEGALIQDMNAQEKSKLKPADILNYYAV